MADTFNLTAAVQAAIDAAVDAETLASGDRCLELAYTVAQQLPKGTRAVALAIAAGYLDMLRSAPMALSRAAA